MDVAVTGSSGLIGTALTRSLQADGHRVHRIVRRPAAGDPDAITWDPANGVLDGAALEGIDAVVHLAGEGIAEKRWTDEQKQRILESRTLGTRLLAETLAGLERPPAVLVSGSAMGIYGDGGDRVLTEDSPPGDIFLSQVCVAWEAAAQPAIDAGIRVPFIRTGVVLSADGGALAKILLQFKLFAGGPMGSGRQWWSWISIDDEVAAICWLLGRPDITGPVNLTAPEPTTNAEFTKALGGVLHRPTSVLPMFAPRLLFGRELADTLLLESQRIVPSVLRRGGFGFAHTELGPTLRHLLDSKR